MNKSEYLKVIMGTGGFLAAEKVSGIRDTFLKRFSIGRWEGLRAHTAGETDF
jgi:hypothetical protein